MTDDELILFRIAVSERKQRLKELVDQLDPAPADVESLDLRSDAVAEAIFLRAFTAYERDIEKLFLHYVTGGRSTNGVAANSYLRVTDESQARRLTKAGFPFLSWGKPQNLRDTAENYIDRGWPFVDMMATRTQILSDCEKVRNRIAHNSIEAIQQFNAVQRNLLATERLFDISPGQFLRVRNQRLRKIHLNYFVDAFFETVDAICEPPP